MTEIAPVAATGLTNRRDLAAHLSEQPPFLHLPMGRDLQARLHVADVRMCGTET